MHGNMYWDVIDHEWAWEAPEGWEPETERDLTVVI